jgi:hypothetical protein
MISRVYMKVVRRGHDLIVSICDSNLLGRTLQDKEKGITFPVSEAFYKGCLTTIKDALELARNATIVNLVGGEIVEAALKEGLIHIHATVRIAGVPHAQVIR